MSRVLKIYESNQLRLQRVFRQLYFFLDVFLSEEEVFSKPIIGASTTIDTKYPNIYENTKFATNM